MQEGGGRPEQVVPGQVSPDGQFMWDGGQWQPITGTTWQPTDWTRPMQVAAAAYLAVSGLFTILTPIVFAAEIKDAALRQLQRQRPSVPADQQPQLLDLGLKIALVVAVILGILYVALALLTIVRRFSLVFYIDLVVFGLGAIGVITNLVAIGSPDSAQPPLVTALGIVFSLASLGLFVWMLVGRIRRGVWACLKVPVAGVQSA